jgi:hypothetical protein
LKRKTWPIVAFIAVSAITVIHVKTIVGLKDEDTGQSNKNWAALDAFCLLL